MTAHSTYQTAQHGWLLTQASTASASGLKGRKSFSSHVRYVLASKAENVQNWHMPSPRQVAALQLHGEAATGYKRRLEYDAEMRLNREEHVSLSAQTGSMPPSNDAER